MNRWWRWQRTQFHKDLQHMRRHPIFFGVLFALSISGIAAFSVWFSTWLPL